MRFITYLLLFLFSVSYSQTNNVGINTTSPMQKLHIAGADATMRVEKMNATNNKNNNGTVNAPLYVDSEGIYSLDLDLLLSNPELDEFNGNLPSSNIYQNGVNYRAQELYNRTVTVTRETYLEIKYTLSYQVSLDMANTIITDGFARLIQNYVLLDYGTRKYGLTSKCYVNSDTDGVNTTYYNNAEMYILLPPGTHTISFYGNVGTDSTSDNTYVNFGLDHDILLMRLY